MKQLVKNSSKSKISNQNSQNSLQKGIKTVITTPFEVAGSVLTFIGGSRK